MRKPNYDKHPYTKVEGDILLGWNDVLSALNQSLSSKNVLAIDTYVGVHDEEIKAELKKLSAEQFIMMSDLMKSEEEIKEMTQPFMTEDTLFGYITNLRMADFFDKDKLEAARKQLAKASSKTVVYGIGAALITPDDAKLVYADMARWEILLRFRKNSVVALGVDDRKEPYSIQYKRGYFVDWIVCDYYKDKLFHRVDLWLDTHVANEPKMITKEVFFKGMQKTIARPFRVVPFFAPAPWGGQWMKKHLGLDEKEINYGWCFDCVPEENSLLFKVQDTLFELPSNDIVLLESRKLLGEPVEARFGKDFPIRFDLLDTFDGGSLSFQVHPTANFIKEQFGMSYTQDESYYMIDVAEGGTVYLGLNDNVEPEEMIRDLKRAERGEIEFDAEKYGNLVQAKKHDHYLIPGGTVHCSGPNGLVLEISSTPNLFTFKLWDWGRMDLDGKPRPINVDRGMEVIQWHRDKKYAEEKLINALVPIAEGEGWMEEKTGLHEAEFIETRRHKFTTKVHHHTNNSVNVLNLVEGEEVIVESVDGSFESFVVHYAETFIVPAWLKEYTIRPYGKSEGKECMTIKAYIRF